MSLLDVLAPHHSRRRIGLKMLRDFLYRPRSLVGHLAAENFHNARVAARLHIHCAVCGEQAGLSYDYPDVGLRRAHGIGLLRETLSCRACGATMRDRQMAFGLLKVVAARLGQVEQDLRAFVRAPRGRLAILDTDSFSTLNRVLRGLPGYVHSQYRPDLPNGQVLPDGSANVDLLQIPFPADSFDVIMTSDVMEHVEHDAHAHREILRCLAPGATYVFTIPYDPCLQGTRRLTVPSGAYGTPFVLEKQVHGDPHSASGIVAHRIYGQDFLREMGDLGYEIRFEEIHNPVQGIFGGDLFLASKRP